MLACWYDHPGPAGQVLRVGEVPDPVPGPGQVRVKVRVSGVNPGDTKKRGAWTGAPLPFPWVIPHSDAAGTIDMVGAGVPESRVGERVWTYGAQSYRAFGTAAQLCVVPEDLAVTLPDAVGDDQGACLGIPGITAHRLVFADGPVEAMTVLVHGVGGAVGSMAAQLAIRGGAAVIGTVRRSGDVARLAPALTAALTGLVALDSPPVTPTTPAAPAALAGAAGAAIREYAPGGVDRIIEVALGANADLDSDVVTNGAVIACYATNTPRTEIPFWPLLFSNVVLRLVGSDDVPAPAKQLAARELTAAAATGALSTRVAARYPLTDTARAHDHVDAGANGRVLIDLPH